MRVNEYVAAYNERIQLPFDNSLNIELIGAYKNVRLKPRFIEDGGFLEGRYYWPLRYYVGGRNFLSGYPLFHRLGDQIALRPVSATDFRFSSALAVALSTSTFPSSTPSYLPKPGWWAISRALRDIDFWKGDRWKSQPNMDQFLTDVGGELRLQLFTFYRIPMFAYFQVARPLPVVAGEAALDHQIAQWQLRGMRPDRAGLLPQPDREGLRRRPRRD